jgi:hypothetical protein
MLSRPPQRSIPTELTATRDDCGDYCEFFGNIRSMWHSGRFPSRRDLIDSGSDLAGVFGVVFRIRQRLLNPASSLIDRGYLRRLPCTRTTVGLRFLWLAYAPPRLAIARDLRVNHGLRATTYGSNSSELPSAGPVGSPRFQKKSVTLSQDGSPPSSTLGRSNGSAALPTTAPSATQ